MDEQPRRRRADRSQGDRDDYYQDERDNQTSIQNYPTPGYRSQNNRQSAQAYAPRQTNATYQQKAAYAAPPYAPGAQVVNVQINTGAQATEGQSYFDGGLLQLIGWTIVGALITVFTLGICYPWALCMQYGWKINHTVIEGRRLRFSGSAVGLFGHWIKWFLLSIITLGIYALWVGIKLEQWRVKNTSFE